MKKLLTGILMTAMVFSIGATSASAAGCGWGYHYADADGDGICDYAGTSCPYYADANGDGICDNYGTAQGRYFVDADGDGICDNYSNGVCPGNGMGQGRGFRGGCHRWNR